MFLKIPFRPLFEARTYGHFLFVAAAIPLAAVVLAVVLAGWIAVAVLAITPLVVPVLVGYRGAIGLLARADAGLSRSLLEVTAEPPISSGGQWFWGRAKAVLVDESFWRQQAYLVLRMGVGFALAVAQLSLIALGAWWITYPAWYRWADMNLGSWHFHTFGRSLLFVLPGLVALVAAGWCARLFAGLSAWQVRSLLTGRPAVQMAEVAGRSDVRASKPRTNSGMSAKQRRARRRVLAFHASAVLALVFSQVVVWHSAGGGYFWPEWVMLPLGLILAIHAWVEFVDEAFAKASAATRGLAIHAGMVAALGAFLTLLWAVTGQGYYWPGWVLFGLAIPLGIHGVIVLARRRGHPDASTARASA
ncbi:MAG TPA: sensor domain-containing protein [Gaiella sp.]|nr:sensor domain-containing protein [Gaiella sp.]